MAGMAISEICAQLSREQALETLVGIAQDPKNEPKDRVHALQVHAEISGGDAPMNSSSAWTASLNGILTELRAQPIGGDPANRDI